MWRKIRIALLLFVLVSVAHTAWVARGRTTEWKYSVRVAVYPIAADGSPVSSDYIKQLQVETFTPIADFMKREAAGYALPLTAPIDMYLAHAVESLPPSPPFGGSTLDVIVWSLKFRYWAWKVDNFKRQKPDVRLFVLYHDPARNNRLPHSTGLQKGLIGIVNAYAQTQYEGTNNVVIAHEMLHTLGATDKYDLGTTLPLFPAGYAEPQLKPAHPQSKAEIMAGRIPVSETRAEIPTSLAQCVVGTNTAREINWLKPSR